MVTVTARRFLQSAREFLYGLTGYEFAETARRRRVACEQVFMLAIIGDLLGAPIPRSYYSLGLLPHLAAAIPGWRRRMLKEKDLTEVLGYELS
ncbi:MAG: hypothetical protein QME92_13050 [Bacillota bacterium]|nr:hypothetical protein [Bacillota bacterium]